MQKLRCPGCGRVLFHHDAHALRPGCALEIMCKDCKTVTRLTGHPAGFLGEVVEAAARV